MAEMSGGQSVEQEPTCACRWKRDTAGRLEFRECSEHYVARVFPPAATEDAR